MIFIEHTNYSDASIRDNFGAPEYSYRFVMKAFEPALDRVGARIEVRDPEREVDPIFAAARARGEDCLFLSFSPPQKTPLGLECPTVPVFAWEYDTIPHESWSGDPRHDWRYVLARTAGALTLCSATTAAVRKTMGGDYPVWTTPAPVFDRFAAQRTPARGWREPFELSVEGAAAISAGEADLSAFQPGRPAGDGLRALQMVEQARQGVDEPTRLSLSGVIYTAVLCPRDARKNWQDMIAAFVWAFRAEPSATLVIKLTQAAFDEALAPMLRFISTLGRFDCRVILLHGMLSDQAYAALIDASSYAVNTSIGEGQCMPLVEYMSCGRPAVAPNHTAMQDYLTPQNAFIVASSPRPAVWPHDERLVIRGQSQLVSFSDLVRQFQLSHAAARDAARYARMSRAAIDSVEAFCAEAVVADRLGELVASVRRATQRPRQAV
jgi:glycosyltransferase involved in cell wall biosynthesis